MLVLLFRLAFFYYYLDLLQRVGSSNRMHSGDEAVHSTSTSSVSGEALCQYLSLLEKFNCLRSGEISFSFFGFYAHCTSKKTGLVLAA